MFADHTNGVDEVVRFENVEEELRKSSIKLESTGEHKYHV